jgi:hypothetical protein
LFNRFFQNVLRDGLTNARARKREKKLNEKNEKVKNGTEATTMFSSHANRTTKHVKTHKERNKLSKNTSDMRTRKMVNLCDDIALHSLSVPHDNVV